MDAPRPPAPPVTRLPELDGLRGLAILLVLVFHYFAGPAQPAPGSWLALAVRPLLYAWSGVDLFFVLSGFLIGGILIDQRASGNYFRVFYFRRACRILPLYYAWLLIYFALRLMFQSAPWDTLLSHQFRDPGLTLWPYGLFLQNFSMSAAGEFGPAWLGATWSLAVEEQFYLVLPLLVRWLPPRRLPGALGLLIIAAPLARIALYQRFPGNFLPAYTLMPCRADALLLGVLCAWAVRQEGLRLWLARRTGLLYLLLLSLLAATGLMIARGYPRESFAMAAPGYSLLALLYACLLLLAVSERRGPVSALLRWTPLRRLGLLAYGIYIFHLAANVICHQLILGRWPQMKTAADLGVSVVALLVTFTVAWLSWNLFERRLVRIGQSRPYLPPA
jgi:peptidoglycan/LPS O-acetylase OafA/YrhL